MADDKCEFPAQEKRKRIDLRQYLNEDEEAQDYCTIHNLPPEVLNISLSLLGGGHFRYTALACKMFLKAYHIVSDKKITTGESATSSTSRAKKYFEDEGEFRFFWCIAAKYNRVVVMEWARQQGYTRIRQQVSMHGAEVCSTAAKYGQLGALKWLKRNGCEWDADTLSSAAAGGHFSCLRWAIENGCE